MSDIEPPIEPLPEAEPPQPGEDVPPAMPSLIEQNNALLVSIDNKMKDHGTVLAQHTLELQAIKAAVTDLNDKTADSTP